MQVITTHKNTDFDALASSICATLLYPGAVPVLPRSLNANVRGFLSIHKDVLETFHYEDIRLDAVDRLIVVDVNQWHRLGRIGKGLRNREDLDIILWDHHMVGGDITAGWTRQEAVGATVTLMSQQLEADAVQLSPIHATLFLAGIYEDTGNLLFPATTAADARAAAYLLEQGADLTVIGTHLRPGYGEKQKEVLFGMLESAERVRLNGYDLSFSQQTVRGHVANLSLVVQMYLQILNVDAAFGIFSGKDGRCMVIGRSAIDGLDMGAIMRGIGGGGHPAAGSAMLKSVSPEAVEETIRELIVGNQQASVQISDLMSFPVVTVSPDETMETVAHILRKQGCTGLPVVEDGRLVGMISRRDFRRLRKADNLQAPVKAFMSRDVKIIEPGVSPMQAARIMVRHDVGRLPVVEDGRIIGIVTRSDAMSYFYDRLPE
jgi:tRNA nucleotidyltransferase (CCA-adding enzyme)